MSNKQAAEEATGIAENPHGLGTFYMKGEIVVVPQDVPKIIRTGYCIEVPNAGAGSYKAFFVEIAKFDEVEVVEQCSSAGDWTFAVREGTAWRLAFQTNRHPYYGFTYNITRNVWPSFEALCKSV